MAMILREPAPAKVNLFLHITGKRPDGMHLLESLAVFTQAGDVLRAESSLSLSLAVEGPFADMLEGESMEQNLVYRAAQELKEMADVRMGAKLVLEKNLPVGSGIGGGSADAAAAMRLLCRLWNLSPHKPLLRDIARTVGADVPACLDLQPTWMRGIGDELTSWRLPFAMPMVLIHPGKPLLTVDVYRAQPHLVFSKKVSMPPIGTINQFIEWLSVQKNDLQPAAISLMPEIADCLEALKAQPGCLLSRMTGSGATSFGIFETGAGAQQAETALQQLFPQAWVKATMAMADSHAH